MTILKIDNFLGMTPRLPPERLPDGGATLAVNCNFSHGELRSMKGLGPTFEAAPAACPVRAVFTDDGNRFFAWNKPTRAYLSPTIDDTLRRVIYHTEGQGLRVAQTDTMKLSSQRPGPPTQSWALGVKHPAGKPTANISTATNWAGDDGAKITFEVLCKNGAATVKTSALNGNVSEVEKWKEYRITLNENPCGAASTNSGGLTVSDGWIEGTEAAVFHAGVAVDGSGAGITRVYKAGQWRVNANGAAQYEYAGRAWFPINLHPEAGGGGGGPTAPGQNLGYAVDVFGKIWTSTAELFAAMKNGTHLAHRSPITSTTTTAFKATIRNADTGVTHLTQEISPTQLEDGSYKVVIDQSKIDADTQSVAYVAVVINAWDEESAPSEPLLIEKTPGQSVTVRVDHTPDAAQVPVRGVVFYRTYAATPQYFLLNETPVPLTNGTASFTDTTSKPETTTMLTSTEWDAPPPAAHSLTYAGNGSFCCAVGKDLLFSEPYRPHAWPYRMTFPHGVTGAIAIERGVLVTTQAQTYVVAGAHPMQMSQQLLPVEQTGWSASAMARVAGAAVFASNDGLVDTFGQLPSIKGSQQLYTREDWYSVYGDKRLNLRLAAHDGYVLGIVDPSYPLATQPELFMLRLDEPGVLCEVDLGAPVYSATQSGVTDKLYVGTDTGFAEFEGGTGKALDWHSKVFEFPYPMSFGAAIADCVGWFDVAFLADGNLVHVQQDVSSYTPFRLPSYRPERRWEIIITGRGVFRSLQIGSTFGELKGA